MPPLAWPSRSTSSVSILALALVIGVGLLVTPGCEIIGAPIAAFDPDDQPETVAAQYHGLAHQRVAVFVLADGPTRQRFPSAVRNLKATVSRAIAENVEGVTVTPTQDALDYQRRNPVWSVMPASRVLRALDVDRLVTIDIAEYRTQEPGNQHLWRGVIDAEVAVYEADAWDADHKAFAQNVRAEFPEGTTVGLVGADHQSMQAAAIKTFTRRASGLFFDYEE